MVSQSLTIFFSACLITGSLHRARAFSTPAFRLGHCGSASITPVSLTRASSRTAGRQRRCYVGVALAADESGDGEPTLYTGSDAEAKLEEPMSMYPADEADYLAASRKRNEEAKRKLLEETAREEAEAEERAKAKLEEGPTESNYGPGDLSGLSNIMTSDDSDWKGSIGQDDSGLLGLETTEGDVGEGGEPTLFIPSGDGSDGDDSQLIL